MIDAMDVKRKMHAWSANETWDQLERSNSTTDDATRDTLVQITFCVLYTSIFILGVFGNVLVCYVVSRKKEMQTVTNLFIANLAVSDILLCVLAVPFTPLYTFLGRWAFGRLMCHLMPYAQAVSVYISSLTLSSIAVDRFLVIIYPIRARMTVNTCFAVIVAVWIVALLLTLPFGIYIQFQEKNNANFCEENWPTEDFRRVFGAVTSTMQFIVPFLVVTFCYVRVWIRLNDRERCRPGSKSDKQEELDRKRKRRTNWMIISMVGVFVISWLPLNIVNIVSDFSESANNWPYFNLCFFVTHCLAMSSTCYNPFIYAWLNENFRKEFKQVLPCFSGVGAANARRAPRQSNNTEKLCNGKNGSGKSMQESLLARQTRRKSNAMQDPESIVMTSLEPATITTCTKDALSEISDTVL